MKNLLVVGIAGATCSGKTSLANSLSKNLKNCTILNQDNYFLPEDDPRHTFIPELNHINWEIITSMDMEKMIEDIEKILQSSNTRNEESENMRILILEGLLLFDSKDITEICDLKYFIDLDYDECWKRRQIRVYDPPDVPNYFQKIVWPEYLKSKGKIMENKKLCGTVTFLNGTESKEENFKKVFEEIKKNLNSLNGKIKE